MKNKSHKHIKLKTSINQKYIFSIKGLSHHTKCILSKIITDFLFSTQPMGFSYLEENIFSIWSEDVVETALDELAENDIMFINICDDESCVEDECESEELFFNPDFIKKACPYLDRCSCCNPAPANFNVIYN